MAPVKRQKGKEVGTAQKRARRIKTREGKEQVSDVSSIVNKSTSPTQYVGYGARPAVDVVLKCPTDSCCQCKVQCFLT